MPRRMRIDDLEDVAVPSAPALSPDGGRIAYVLRTVDREADRDVEEIWQVGTAAGPARRLTAGPSDTSPAWSPDGGRLAFLRAREDAGQLWLLPANGGEAEPLTALPLGAGTPVWSPDGARIAFTAWVDILAAGTPGPGLPPAGAGQAPSPLVTERVDYQPDGAGLLHGRRRHLHVVEIDSGECRQVTAGDWHAGPPAWAPDGTRLAFTARMDDDGDLTARSAAYVLDVDEPAARPRPAGPAAAGVAGAVTWTADGAAVLVVGTVGPPVGHARLLRLGLDGSEPVDLAPALDRNVMAGGPGYPGAVPQLVDGGASVLFCVRDRGCTHLYQVGIQGGPTRLVLGGAGRTVSGLSVAGGTAAVALGSPTSYGEIATVDVGTGTETAHTEHGAPLASVTLFPREERRFAISDGTVVSGWLVRDPARSGPRPVLLDVHGGPHNAWNAGADEIHLYHQELAARGWVVLLVNPRGSDGYGEAFYTGVFGAWGESDAKDLLEPLDQLVEEGVADPRRLAVTGYSYGGFMTCYLTGIDDRFAAAAGGGVVSDLTSMVGTCDEGPAMAVHELGAQPWEDRARYERLSPYSRVDRVRTPTLLLHGAADTTCPVGQAQQWHEALRARGVPTGLVLYPGGSHLVILSGPPSHRRDYNRRVLDWVEQYAAVPAAAEAG